jgi:hypothetical protein
MAGVDDAISGRLTLSSENVSVVLNSNESSPWYSGTFSEFQRIACLMFTDEPTDQIFGIVARRPPNKLYRLAITKLFDSGEEEVMM